MKSRRPGTTPQKNQSKGHQKIGLLLREIFPAARIYEEYPVRRLNKDFRSGRERFDWIVLDLQIVIEVQGAFHFKPIPWGNPDKAEVGLEAQQERDKTKREAAEDKGWKYLALTTKEVKDLTANRLRTLLSKLTFPSPSSPIRPPQEKIRKGRIRISLGSLYRDKLRKEETRKRWRESYQKAKAWRKEREKALEKTP